MRESAPRGWHRRRASSVPEPVLDRLGLGPLATPGPDPGIRHELVARIRQQIADGTYDTEEKWLLAEDALLRRIEGRA